MALMCRLEKELRPEESAGERADRSTDEESLHARVIAVAAITFNVSAEKSAREKAADASGYRAGDDVCFGPCATA
jgi:hypothetical protein